MQTENYLLLMFLTIWFHIREFNMPENFLALKYPNYQRPTFCNKIYIILLHIQLNTFYRIAWPSSSRTPRGPSSSRTPRGRITPSYDTHYTIADKRERELTCVSRVVL